MADSRLQRDALTVEYVLSILNYNPETGIFTWKGGRPRVHEGMKAGSPGKMGHLEIEIDSVCYHANRLAWFVMTGSWPTHLIDHKNNVSDDNSWTNLRPATRAQNRMNTRCPRNNRCGLKGVTARYGKWIARIRVAGKLTHLGSFLSPEDAHAAYVSAASKYFGEFANAG